LNGGSYNRFMKKAIETALITGASQGLGRALAEALAGRGVTVALVARNQDKLEATVAAIRQAGGHAFGIVGDIADKETTHRISGQAAALLGTIDLLVHNASELGPIPLELLLDTACEDLERVFAVNLVGPFRLAKTVVGPMLLRGSGSVLFVSSDAATSAYPRWGAYGASKAAADHLARIFAAELEGSGVWVSIIDPGEMRTAMHAAAMPGTDPATLADPRDVAERVLSLLDARAAIPSGARVIVPDWRDP
jgi:NAD(P)-dependent dehydrogenase (short-subunit alcohol dehydrogenase family)